MKVILGHIFNDVDGRKIGEEFYITEPDKHPLPINPVTKQKCQSHLEFLSVMQSDKKLRDAGGWSEVTKLEGEREGKTRWQRMVEACNHPSAPADHKALKLVDK